MKDLIIDRLLSIAKVCLSFGSVLRQTKDIRGEREADSTHSIMLSIVACTIAHENGLGLDRGLISQLSVVHDLQEFKFGDISTLRISSEGRKNKDMIENMALADLYDMFPDSWLKEMLFRYHCQIEPEARFVRAVDKILPKLTHLLNNLIVLEEVNMSADEFHERISISQREEIKKYAGEFKCVIDIHSALCSLIENKLNCGRPHDDDGDGEKS